MKNIVIGTAGHIDHGKTTLIKFLTGIDPDRLPEEKEKQMTIDIGFSFIKDKNMNISIIDVPGHQKFIKNMLSGVFGINYVLFLIACDDGIMPQTIEHFEILKLLDIKSGLIILTKTDLVASERIEKLKLEVKERFKGSFLENFEMIETSSKDAKSFENLKIKILKNISKLNLKNRKEDFLMYIDRSFSIKGAGTVVTGTVSSGKINLGDNLFLYPDRKKLKVKSIEKFGEKCDFLEENSRGALNLNGIEYKKIKRGYFLSSNDNLISTDRIDVSISILEEKSIKNNQKIRIYLGTDETIGKILFFEKNLGQVIFEEKIFCFEDQLGIIRNYSPLETLGGIRILNTKAQKISKKNIDYSNYIENLKDIFEKKDLNQKKNYKSKEKFIEELEKFHKNYPLKKGIKFNKLDFNIQDILNDLEKENYIKIIDNFVSLYNFKIKLTKSEKDLKEKIFKIYKNSRFYVVKYEIIEKSLENDFSKNEISKIHKYMVENEMIIYLEEDKFILSGFFKETQKKLIDYFSCEENFKKGMTLGEFRNLIQTNRESAISIMSKLEKINFLINKENIRFLRKIFKEEK